MVKVLIIHPIARATEPPYHIPFGAAMIAAVCDSMGVQTAVLDLNAHRIGLDAFRHEIRADKWDLIGISALSSQYKYVKQLLPIIREEHPDALIVGGGGCFASQPVEMLKWNKGLLDVVVIGEGENTFVELLDVVYSRRFHEVRGLAYWNEKGEIEFSEPRPLIGMKDSGVYESLDDLPYPAYDLLPMEVYLANSRIPLCPETLKPNIVRLSFVHERGCPFQCRFCTHLGHSSTDLARIYHREFKGWPVLRRFSPEYVVKHVKYARLRWGINFASMLDENMLASKEYCLQLAKLWEEEGLAGLVNFGILGHPATADFETILKLRDVGLKYISFGAENANKHILEALNKKSTPEQIQNAINVCQKSEVYPITTWMISPEDNVDTVLNTVRFWKRNGIVCKPFFETAYPGTELFEKYRDRIINEYLTDEDKELIKRRPKRAKEVKDRALERFVLALGDATDLVHNLSSIWNDAELLGIQQLMFLQDERRLLKLKKIDRKH